VADGLVLLNESDGQDFNQIRDLIGGTIPKGRRLPRNIKIQQCTDIYLAKTPDDGIPALSRGADTGTGDGDPPVPGSAVCTIYKQIIPTNSQQVEMVPAGMTKLVYNLSLGSIRGQSWIEVKKTKYGLWFANAISTQRRWAYTTEDLAASTLAAPTYTSFQIKKMNFGTGVFSNDGSPEDGIHAWAHEIPNNTLCRVEFDEEFGRWSIYAVNCEAD